MIGNRFDGSGERFKELRKCLNMTQTEFSDILNISHGHISGIEKDKKNITDSIIDLLKLKCNVNDEWLRTGEGEMFLQLPEEDEVASYVSELLEDNGENPLYEIIKEIMHTYNELSPKSQEVLRDASARLLENLKRKRD